MEDKENNGFYYRGNFISSAKQPEIFGLKEILLNWLTQICLILANEPLPILYFNSQVSHEEVTFSSL